MNFSQYKDFKDFCELNNVNPEIGFVKILEKINFLSDEIKKIKEVKK